MQISLTRRAWRSAGLAILFLWLVSTSHCAVVRAWQLLQVRDLERVQLTYAHTYIIGDRSRNGSGYRHLAAHLFNQRNGQAPLSWRLASTNHLEASRSIGCCRGLALLTVFWRSVFYGPAYLFSLFRQPPHVVDLQRGFVYPGEKGFDPTEEVAAVEPGGGTVANLVQGAFWKRIDNGQSSRPLTGAPAAGCCRRLNILERLAGSSCW